MSVKIIDLMEQLISNNEMEQSFFSGGATKYYDILRNNKNIFDYFKLNFTINGHLKLYPLNIKSSKMLNIALTLKDISQVSYAIITDRSHNFTTWYINRNSLFNAILLAICSEWKSVILDDELMSNILKIEKLLESDTNENNKLAYQLMKNQNTTIS